MLTGPNLPHKVGDVPPDAEVPLRSRVVQFSEAFAAEAMRLFPELAACGDMLETSRALPARGGGPCWPYARRIGRRHRRAADRAFHGHSRRAIGGAGPAADQRQLPARPVGVFVGRINEALAWINGNLTEPFSETDLAAISRLGPGAFSRSFRRHTGMTLVECVNRLRINLACQRLMDPKQPPFTEVCLDSGFNNLSNFNRQFLAQKGMTPSRFRALMRTHTGTPAAA